MDRLVELLLKFKIFCCITFINNARLLAFKQHFNPFHFHIHIFLDKQVKKNDLKKQMLFQYQKLQYNLPN